MTTLTVAGTGVGSMVDVLAPDAPILKYIVISSILTWARDSDLRKHGWWAGSFGSFLWKLARATSPLMVVTYIENATNWMKEQGIADEVYVQAGVTDDRLWCTVVVKRGEKVVEVHFDNLWNGVLDAR